MLQCSFSFAAAQLLVKMTSAPQKSECCSATSAAQHSKNCSTTSVFACSMLQGWGLEGWGLGLADMVRNAARVHGFSLEIPNGCSFEALAFPVGLPLLGVAPSTAKHFRSEIRSRSGNAPETLSEQILNFQVSHGWRSPKPWKLKEIPSPD